jgi:heat shock protein HslJ
MKPIKILSLGILLLIFGSCGSTTKVNSLSLLSKNIWSLSSFMDNALDTEKFSSGTPTLHFFDGEKLAGFAGCNNFSGTFSLEGDKVKLDPGAMTKKACEGTGEKEFIEALSKVNNLRVEKEKLILLIGVTELMSFIPMD